MITVRLTIGGHVWRLYKLPGRLLLVLPGFQMGRIYKEKSEAHDTLPDGIYFLFVIGVPLLIEKMVGKMKSVFNLQSYSG